MTLSNTQRWGVVLLAILTSYAFLVPFVSSGNSATQNLSHILMGPDNAYWFGTDHFGRDMWLRLADALKLSVQMALFCVCTAALIGVSLGMFAACGPRWADRMIDGISTLILALPGLVLVLIFAAIAPGSFVILYLAISLVQWIEFYRVTRVIAMRLVQSPEVQSSRLMGFGMIYLFRRHYWPALAPQMLTLMAFGAANAILMMASLGFVHVGIQPPLAELGLMIVEHFPFYSDAPWLLALPLTALALLVLSFHLLGRAAKQ